MLDCNDLSSILERSKEFEFLVITHDPSYNDQIAAIELVKTFIIENNLIVYGGTAIDYALRLHGDKIYPDDMLAVPDLDFYSPNNVDHAYQIADILYKHGYGDARAINALHMETMRVDLVDNHFIADITYRPKDMFDQLPYITYNGMRVIHPDFQRIDVHSSLSYPYDNPPREVIFDRWSKDIKRFNKLAAVYPIPWPVTNIVTRKMTIEHVTKYVLCGFAAYAIVYNEFVREISALSIRMPKDIAPAVFEITDKRITFDTLDQNCEIIHFDPKKAISELKLTNVKRFEPYINLLLERMEGVISDNKVTVYSTHHRLITINSISINDVHVRITNIQFLLKHFLSMYFVKLSTPKIASVYLSRYTSLLTMIKTIDAACVEDSIVFPTVQPYGNDNINLARTITLNRLYNELENTPLYKIPQNYYPARSVARGVGPPSFDPNEVIFFHESGEEIPIESALN